MEDTKHSCKSISIKSNEQKIESDSKKSTPETPSKSEHSKVDSSFKNTGAFVLIKSSFLEKLRNKIEKVLQLTFKQEHLVNETKIVNENFEIWNIRFRVKIPDGSLKLSLSEEDNKIVGSFEKIEIRIFFCFKLEKFMMTFEGYIDGSANLKKFFIKVGIKRAEFQGGFIPQLELTNCQINLSDDDWKLDFGGNVVSS